jgi:anaerobic selenocysteine-containing dehydrogenase
LTILIINYGNGEEFEFDKWTTAVETREFSAVPFLATLIAHFEDKDQWTVEELSNETGIPEYQIQKLMSYWVNNRVVKQKIPLLLAQLYTR